MPPSELPPCDPRAQVPDAPLSGEPAARPIERVADYPRPPRLEPCALPVRVEALGRVLAEGDRSLRVLETFHPPTLYLPPEVMDLTMLQPAPGHSFCEWKGVARYFNVVLPHSEPTPPNPCLRRLVRAVWQYPEPAPAFAALAGWYAVYPALMDAC